MCCGSVPVKKHKIDLKTGAVAEGPAPLWLHRVLSNNAVINLFTDYISLPCYVVDRRQPDLWYTLSAPAAETSPFQFELYFGKREARLQYNHKCFDQAAQTKKGVLDQRSGLWDYFVPVLQNGKCVAYVVSGSFQRPIPNFETLSKQFSLLAGKAPGLADPIFHDYVQVLLQTTYISDQALTDYRKLIDLLAKFV